MTFGVNRSKGLLISRVAFKKKNTVKLASPQLFRGGAFAGSTCPHVLGEVVYIQHLRLLFNLLKQGMCAILEKQDKYALVDFHQSFII